MNKFHKIQNRIQDSLKKQSKKIAEINAEINAWEEEKKLLTKNNSIAGQTNGVSAAELIKMADLFRTRLREINTQMLKLEEARMVVSESFSKTTKQLDEQNAKENQASFHIMISVNAEAPVNANIEFKYLIEDAGWDPYYDIRALDVSTPISFDYKAKIYNNCGLDWNDVKLTLSTADPSLSAQKPKLDPWNLNYKSTDDFEGQLNKQGYLRSESLNEDKKGKMSIKQEASSVEVSELTVDFEIKAKYTIPSNNKIYIVDIQTIEIPASYTYFSVPKIEKEAFLIASITGWEALNLIEGPANIYFAGTYVGQSYIDTRFANDTLDISMGRDKKVAITRTKKQDFADKKFFGTNKKESFLYEISIRNNNKVSIEIEIQDQLPVSQESDIKVEAIETSGIKADEQSGILKYNYKIAPSESKIIKIAYSIQYPKSKNIKIRKSRQTQKSMRFL